MDFLRLFLFPRYMSDIKNELHKEIISIIIRILINVIFMAFILQLIENEYAMKTTGDHHLIQNCFEYFYFIMTTISLVGYGSTIASP